MFSHIACEPESITLPAGTARAVPSDPRGPYFEAITMPYLDAFHQDKRLIDAIGESNAHMVWAIALYLEEPDAEALASDALTDGPDDKKLDFVYLDQANRKIVLAQGYYSLSSAKDSAPANKASDLNTGAAWLVSGDLNQVPQTVRPAIEECRAALENNDIESIELLYVHNLPESVNVTRELRTAAQHLNASLRQANIAIIGRELGSSAIEQLFLAQDSQIAVKDTIVCPSRVQFTENGPNWTAAMINVPGPWLRDLFRKYGDALFSANYRGFLGIGKRRRINASIMSTAKDAPKDFWVFNNGITLLTRGLSEDNGNTTLTGVSIINGAQTTGSIGSVDNGGLSEVKVLCRAIICNDSDTISSIIQFNNTQNEITTWDQYSNDPEQSRIAGEFAEIGYQYSRKRGFRPISGEIGIEDVAQPLVSFHGRFRDANSGKNRIFERLPLYRLAFERKKARHILLVHTLAVAIDDLRLRLKQKSTAGTIIEIEQQQLKLLRHLRFKQFFIALMSRVLDNIVGRRCDRELVAFSPAAVRDNRLVELIAAWSPIVEAILALASAQLDASTFTEFIAEDDAVDRASKSVGAIVYASRANLPLGDFPDLVSAS